MQKLAEVFDPRLVSKSLRTRKTFQAFADELDMVYFGNVAHDDEERRLLGGVTASVTHTDMHYSVGTYKTYDVAMALRIDNVAYLDRRIKRHYWTIMTIDLHTDRTIPHFFVTHHTKRELLLAKFNALPQLTPGSHTGLTAHRTFMSDYMVFAPNDTAHLVDAILTPEVTHAIALHFKDISLEVIDGAVYVYYSTAYPSRQELNRMLNAGIWFAQLIDNNSEALF